MISTCIAMPKEKGKEVLLPTQKALLKDVIGRLGNGIYNNRGCPITPYVVHIYHDLDLLTEEKSTTYIDTSRDQEFNFIKDPIVASGTQVEVEQEKPKGEEDDIAEAVGVDVAEKLVVMVIKYIQLELHAKRKYDGNGPSQPNEKKQDGPTLDFEETQEYENSDEQQEEDSKQPEHFEGQLGSGDQENPNNRIRGVYWQSVDQPKISH